LWISFRDNLKPTWTPAVIIGRLTFVIRQVHHRRLRRWVWIEVKLVLRRLGSGLLVRFSWSLCMVIMVVIVVIVVFVVFMVFMRTTFRTIAMEVLVVRSVVVMALCKEPGRVIRHCGCLRSPCRAFSLA